jgi:FKBP-type peptidyl-prolyl cis-trans isomerase
MRCDNVRRVVAAAIAPLLFLTAGCFGGDNQTEDQKPAAGDISDVSVTGGFGEQPVVKFKAPMSFAKTQHKMLAEGSGGGDSVLQNSTVTVDYSALNASDGDTFSTSWNADGKPTPSTFDVTQVFPGFYSSLQGAKAGDRVLMTVASADAFDPTGNSEQTVRAGDSVIMVVDVKKVDNPRVVPSDQFPTLKVDKDGNPSKFVAKATTPDSVGLLSQETLRTGDGDAVAAGDTIKVSYLGQLWPDGATFDANYGDKKPLVIPLASTIEGWQQALVGKTVGSRVVLAIPSALGYGESGSTQGAVAIPPNADLIFVIDIVGIKAPATGQ